VGSRLAFEQQLIPLPVIGGGTRKVALTSGKMAIYDAMDAATGKYASPLTWSANVVTAIDPRPAPKPSTPRPCPRR